MSTLKERDRLETLERPVEEKKRAGRGLWLAAAALVVVVAATVGGFMLFGGGEGGIDFDVTSDYVPAGAAELEGIVTGSVIVLPAPTSSYVPGPDELREALAEAAKPRSDYVPGPNELRSALVALAEPAFPISTYVPGRHEMRNALAAPSIGIEFSLPSSYVPIGANELEMAMTESSIFDMPSTYVPGPKELAEALAETQASTDQLQYR